MRIKQAFKTYATDGSIFKYLPLYGTSTAVQMGLAYVLRHSGQKQASSLVEEFTENGELTETGKQTIGGIITEMFKDNWDKKWAVLQAEYEPLENYRMTEEGSDTDTYDYGQKQKTNQYGAQGGSSTKGQQIDETEDEVSAFNSSAYQDSNKRSFTEGSRSDSYTQNAHTDTETENAVQDEVSKEHSLTRSGNIGVTTSQQMAESELALRSYRFFEEMFRDIDSMVALRVYEDYDRYEESYSPSQTTDIDIDLVQLPNGVRIKVIKDGEVTEQAEVYNGTDGKDGKDGITPDFKIEDGDLYVNP